MDLFERVSEDIKNAMRAKDKVALETLRNIKKVFLEAKTAPGANDTLTDADALKIIQKLIARQGRRRNLRTARPPGPCRCRTGASKSYGSIPAQADVSRRTGSCLEGNHRRNRRYQW